MEWRRLVGIGSTSLEICSCCVYNSGRTPATVAEGWPEVLAARDSTFFQSLPVQQATQPLLLTYGHLHQLRFRQLKKVLLVSFAET